MSMRLFQIPLVKIIQAISFAVGLSADIAVAFSASSNATVAPRIKAVPDARGHELFVKVWTDKEGLGPQMNARSCSACHAAPRVGGAGTDRASMVFLSPDITDPTQGHVVRQFFVRPMGRMARTAVPRNVVVRKPPSLFGLGELERVPETVLRQFADPDDQDGDGISGRMAHAGNGIGRFGWKAKFPRLDDAVAAALVNEMGLTTTLFPNDSHDDRDVRQVEVDGANLQALVEFVRSLQPLPSESIEPQTRNQAEGLFHTVGCGGCHRPTLQVAALPNGGPAVIRPYTDLLVHDMGPALGDGLAEGSAGPQEFRTPPLWGISRTGPPYLHDGRAATIHDAIAAHGGEGQRSADSYTRLTAVQRKALLDFIASR